MKAWKKLLAMLLCFVMLLSLAACGDDSGSDDDDDDKPKETEEQLAEGDKDCAHVWKEWVVMKESTCTKSGTQRRTCDLCGREEEEKLSYTGHMYVDGVCEYCDKAQRACDHEKTKTVLVEQQTCEKDGRENEICSDCYAIVDVSYLYATGHSYITHAYQDPTCTEEGWYSYYTCENCDYTDFPENKREAYGHSFIAGTCTSCGEADPAFETITAPEPVSNPFTVPGAGEMVGFDVADMEFGIISGNMAEYGQVNTHEFTVATDGLYVIVFNSDQINVELTIYDAAGAVIGSDSYCYNDDWMAISCTAGQTYKAEVAYDWRTGDYQLSMALAREVLDVSAYDKITDQLQYAGQVNYYDFTPVKSGNHSFVINDMESGCRVELYINKDGERVSYDYSVNNGDVLVCYDMVAGETYQIQIQRDTTAYSGYSLQINKPADVIDLTGYTSVTDSVSFSGQSNAYTFVPSVSGNCRFVLSEVTDGSVDVYIYDSGMNCIDYLSYGDSGDSFTVDLTAGQSYTIRVNYRYNPTDYTLDIVEARLPLEINSDMAVIDSIDYYDQVNVYHFVADKAGNHKIVVTGLDSYESVWVGIYDDDGDEVDYDYSLYEGESLTIYDVEIGDSYTIKVFEYYDLTGYTLSIQ